MGGTFRFTPKTIFLKTFVITIAIPLPNCFSTQGMRGSILYFCLLVTQRYSFFRKNAICSVKKCQKTAYLLHFLYSLVLGSF